MIICRYLIFQTTQSGAEDIHYFETASDVALESELFSNINYIVLNFLWSQTESFMCYESSDLLICIHKYPNKTGNNQMWWSTFQLYSI